MAIVPVRKTESIFDELHALQNKITKRAFEIFNNKGQEFGRDLENWLEAERELVWKPAIELEEKDNQFHLQIATPGVDPKDINIEVTPEYLLVKAEGQHEHKEDKGEVHVCEFTSGNMFRSVHLPKKIDPDKVQAEFKNGILTVHLPKSAAVQPRQISVKTS